MPSNTKLAKVECPEAAYLADLYSVLDDLSISSFLCSHVLEAAKRGEHANPIIEAIASAAIVRYLRCFGGGVRLGLSQTHLNQLQPENLKNHLYLKDLRDKFIAHSVNPFEESYVNATIVVRDGIKQPVESISAGHHRVVPSASEAKKLFELLSEMQLIVRKIVVAEEEKLLAHIQSLPLDIVHKWDLHSSVIKNSDVSKSRTQSKKQRVDRPKKPMTEPATIGVFY